jgi:hypothetical protein
MKASPTNRITYYLTPPLATRFPAAGGKAAVRLNALIRYGLRARGDEVRVTGRCPPVYPASASASCG